MMTALTIITSSSGDRRSPSSSAAMRSVIRSSAGRVRRSAIRPRVYSSSSSWAAVMIGRSSCRLPLKIRSTSDAQRLNSCQSSFGAPSSSQMIGIGYGSQMSTAMSDRPVGATGSTSEFTTSRMNGRRRSASARRERLADEPAEAGVHVAFGRQDRLTVALGELRVVDPVHLEDATRRAVPALVAEHGDDVVVVQHREAERVAGDPTLSSGLGDGVGLLVERQAGIEEVEDRQIELEHRSRGRLTHGGTVCPAAFDRPTQSGSDISARQQQPVP